MTSAAAYAASSSAVLLDDIARERLQGILQQYQAGQINRRAIRHRVAAVVRAAYRSGDSMAAQYARTELSSELGKRSRRLVLQSEYLASLIKDVNRTLREYHATGDDWEAIARRLELSVGNAAIRGYNDGLQAEATAAAQLGILLRKKWHTDHESNVCPMCALLDGKEVGVTTSFPIPDGAHPYYDNLVPPLHPNCLCVITLETVSD